MHYPRKYPKIPLGQKYLCLDWMFSTNPPKPLDGLSGTPDQTTTKLEDSIMAGKSISDFVNVRALVNQWMKPEDHLNQPLSLVSWEYGTGDFGTFGVMTCVDVTTGEELKISCGAQQVMKVLEALPNPLPEPLEFRFNKIGRMIVIE